MKKLRIGLIIIVAVALLAVLTSCLAVETAYDIAVRNGYTGSEAEWIASLNGTDGSNGQNGADGVGVESVKVDKNGYLIVTLTNGKTVNAGYVGVATPDASTQAPKLNVSKLNMAVGDLFILTSDRQSTVFSSSDEKIVQVSPDGLILAIGEGTATITAKTNDGKTTTCSVNSFAYTYEKLREGGIKLTGYNGVHTKLVIPDNILDEPVKEIESSAFAGTDISSVMLPSTVVTIGENAFNACAELESVELGSGVISIGASAFRDCDSLASIVIPEQVVSLGEYAFADCAMLESITVGDDCNYGESAFVNTPWYETNKVPEPPLNVFISVNETVWVYPTDDYGNHLAEQFSNYYPEPIRQNSLGALKDGTEMTRTGVLYENEDGIGWSRLVYQGQTIYMRNSQITTKDPSAGTHVQPNHPKDIYFYDPSAVPDGKVGIIPLDLSSSDKGLNYISDQSSAYDPDLSEIMKLRVSSSVTAGEPLVLILHTHATEAYTATGVTWYAPNSGDARSNDPTKNVISVGALLAERLNALGIPTLHCEIVHDAETYTGAYGNSAETIKKYLEDYPTIKYVIDLHRDFVTKESTGEIVRPVAEVNGEAAAQMMCVVGSGANTVGGDHWQENLALAQKLRESLSNSCSNLCRPTYLRDSDYNQHLAPYSLLIEMGASGNTLDEVKNSVEILALSLTDVIKGE